ncbi:unnamed protein product [Paramecium sonneborni]|uniref:RAP domain-containing protein n=1 Tax=Paramecium sonneborni TaxID=65129 RepID=A0A8S1R1Q5_9CILI|nr:unnamed protein product [Paramecium sonneborni]
MTVQLNKVTAQNDVPDFLLYLALTENSGLLNSYKGQMIKHMKMHYYLQYIQPHETNYKKDKYFFSNPVFRDNIKRVCKRKYIKEYEVRLYHCDFFLAKSNTIVEVNGYKHYLHFKERKTGNYQQKYNQLIKKGFKIREIEQ